MHTTPIYIKGLAQISIQRPLCDDWMQNGVAHNEAYVRADDPNFRNFLAPLEARRMGRLLKRAAVVAETALKEGATTCPDAISAAPDWDAWRARRNFWRRCVAKANTC